VQAVTELGGGYWVLTPLREADGSIFLVNRGFVPSDARDRVERADRVQPADQVLGTAAGTSTAVSVTGLLRMTEPRGAFLRHNDAAANRWYSRDVQAIAAARGLTRVAPYFIDADAGSSRAPGEGTAAAGAPVEGAGVAPGPGDPAGEAAGEAGVAPVGGLTVVAFRNSHLEYAITWYTLALMVAGATWLGIRSETRA
jgi:surfeit locus 1 family protein